MLPLLSRLNQANGPKLTRTRIILAFGVAILTDGIQLLLGVLGPFSVIPDDVIDVFAMILTTWILGFHWLLLPTFALKLIPFADDLPTWTGCVIAVILIRKREQRIPPSEPPDKPTIEI
jgi:hypothetical protein